MKKNLKYNFVWLLIAALAYAFIYVLYVTGVITPFTEYTLITIGINIMLALGLNLIIGFSWSIFFRSCRIYGDWGV